MRRFLMLTLLAVGLTCPAVAERTCRIVFPERPNASPKVAYLFDGKESRQVTLPSMNFSEVIPLPSGEMTLMLTPSAVTDPKALPPGAPKLKVAEGIRDFYIFVAADPENPTLPVRMNLVNAGDGKLKPGETLWFNLTPHRITAKLGDSRMSVPPNGATVSSNPVATSGYYKAQFAFQADGEGEFQRITEQQWWHDADSRHVGMIVGTGGKLPRIYCYRDFR